jgi:hypothetical protein
MPIENIILSNDQRGITLLQSELKPGYVNRSADLILDNPGKVFITTGFYISKANTIETDGPPGAIAIGNALYKIGYQVIYITDSYSTSFIKEIRHKQSRLIEFPIMGVNESKEYALKLMEKEQPNLLIAIERPGSYIDDKYRNMRDEEFTKFTARIDQLFALHENTIGIGDGGNEIGMGNLFAKIQDNNIVKYPSTSKVSELIISSVSNWGGYGLVGALSIKTGKDLLPSPSQDSLLISKLVDMGAVDGISANNEYKVDGFTMKENSKVLINISDFVKPYLTQKPTET